MGIRVPDHPLCAALLAELGEPLLSTTARLAGDELPLSDGDEVYRRLSKRVDLLLDAGACGVEPTSMVDLSDGVRVLREGRGDISAFTA